MFRKIQELDNSVNLIEIDFNNFKCVKTKYQKKSKMFNIDI